MSNQNVQHFFRQIKAVQKLASFEIQSPKEEVRRNRKTSKTEKVRQANSNMPLLVEGSSLMWNGIIKLALSIAMIVIGDQYNTLDACSFQISQVLEVMGGLMLFNAILFIILGLAFCTETIDCGAICAIVVTCLAQFGVQIWASVVVFGKSLDFKFLFPFKVIVYKSCSELFLLSVWERP